jgi:hypothetical protein
MVEFAMSTLTVKHENLIQRVLESYIGNPLLSVKERAAEFGCSPTYMGSIINSDNFQSKLRAVNEGREETVLQLNFAERVEGLQIRALEVLSDKLEETCSADMALKILDVTASLGGKSNQPVQQGASFTINLAAKAESPEAWEQEYAKGN